jgi:hypothetical protein
MKTGKSLGYLLGSVIAPLLLVSTNAKAGPIITNWDVGSAAIGGGNCTKSDTQLIAVQGQLSVIFDKMGIDLPCGNPTKTIATSCTVAVKVKFNAPGWVELLQQNLVWGWSRKGSDAIGQASLMSSICGSNYVTTTESVFSDLQASYVTEQDYLHFNVPTKECLYVAHIGMAAKKEKTQSCISLRIAGEDVELDVW